MIPVILSGGQGTRLWPLSRSNYPKQFLPLLNNGLKGSLFKKTLDRLNDFEKPWVITGQSLVNLTFSDVGRDRLARVIGEPMGKNTAPAIATACHLMRHQPKEVLGIFPSDHLIADEVSFVEALKLAVKKAQNGEVATLGIVPSYPATGYGYIQTSGKDSDGVFKAIRFCEKPNLEKARSFLNEGGYFWNAGIFLFSVETMTQLFCEHMPSLWKKISTLKDDLSNLKNVYGECESQSIDYGIMEKLNSIACVPLNAGWSDVGSFDEIVALQKESKLGENSDSNINLDSSGCSGVSLKKKKFAFIDVKDINVVESDDAVLVFKSGSSQKVKDVFDKIKNDPLLVTDPKIDFRPWGSFEVLRDESNFKSKLIKVLPGQKISYQSHEKRAENWVIVKGKAKVILDEKEIILNVGQSIFIPTKAKHRIENIGNEVLEFVEVQTGTYFGEDDIVRYSDDYGR
jgi:mannose-1-phosphate guanylyltransferase/mannose-1-phosphate guanylyltransferase/mannose-6-phosphate isomerase